MAPAVGWLSSTARARSARVAAPAAEQGQRIFLWFSRRRSLASAMGSPGSRHVYEASGLGSGEAGYLGNLLSILLGGQGIASLLFKELV
jgi:hypothetical protein